MADYVTKKDLDKALEQHQAVILEAVNAGFERVDKELAELRASITWRRYLYSGQII